MPRGVTEIATDIKDGLVAMATAADDLARAAGNSHSPGATPKVEVSLKDGRVIELVALADELLAAASS